jgi:hypothetical protein
MVEMPNPTQKEHLDREFARCKQALYPRVEDTLGAVVTKKMAAQEHFQTELIRQQEIVDDQYSNVRGPE